MCGVEDEDMYRRFFEEFGYVVIGGVLDEQRCAASVDELWASPSLLGGRPLVRREDPRTWENEIWPTGSRNFLDPLEPCLEEETWRNRVCPAVRRIFGVLWQGLGRESDRLVVSVDRVGIMRPTRLRSGGDAAGAVVERPDWRTSRNWLHWDQNPWASPEFEGMQGLLGLSPASASSGGFVTVPGFHREFAAWGRRCPEGSVPKRTRATVPFPVPLDDEMQGRRRKILVPRGALLVWDSRMPHENFPNEGEGWRCVQYVTAKRLSPDVLRGRVEAWHSGLRSGLVPVAFARRFSVEEQVWLGMAESEATHDVTSLADALAIGTALSEEQLEAARQLRRAYRLKQTAILPEELKEAAELFRSAFAANPALKEPMRSVAAAEGSYLPFWIF